MDIYTRYFVSQHVGKATATVLIEGTAEGQVRIEAGIPPAHAISFKFDSARLAQRIAGPENWCEAAARIAINQMHKHLASGGQPALQGAVYELAVGSAPWLGDLSSSPYGGATAGFDQRQAGPAGS